MVRETGAKPRGRALGAWMGRPLFAATLCGAVETYDWSVYGLLAPYLAAQVFPGGNAFVRLLGAYSGFAIGFAVRPVGGAILGRISDTRGRRVALGCSVAAIGAGSLVIGLGPAGSGGWVLILLVRLAQGLSVGGENPAAAAYVTESAPAAHRFRHSGISYAGAVSGSLLASVVLALLLAVWGPERLQQGWWRLGFLFGAVLAILAVWAIRRAGEAALPADPAPTGARKTSLRGHSRNMIAVFLAVCGGTVGYYFVTVYLPVYLARTGGLDSGGAARLTVWALVVMLVVMPAGGALADRFGIARALPSAYLALALLSWPLLRLMAAGGGWTGPAVMVYAVAVATPVAMNNVFMAELFPARVRVLAVGLAFSCSVALFGGTFPMVAEALSGTGRAALVPWVPTASALVSVAGALLARRRGP